MLHIFSIPEEERKACHSLSLLPKFSSKFFPCFLRLTWRLRLPKIQCLPKHSIRLMLKGTHILFKNLTDDFSGTFQTWTFAPQNPAEANRIFYLNSLLLASRGLYYRDSWLPLRQNVIF